MRKNIRKKVSTSSGCEIEILIIERYTDAYKLED